jgi:DNA-directed RNA polymerase subunit RPC12/RpoP
MSAKRRNAQALKACCPQCGSRRIEHIERVICGMRVATFTRDVNGEVCVHKYTGNPNPDWQNADALEYPFQCMRCQAELQGDDLVLAPAR